MKLIKLGSVVPSPVMADIASFMDIDDALQLSLTSPRANNVLFSHRALARKISSFEVSRNEISSDERTIPLDDNLELAQKQILCFLRTVNEVEEEVKWEYHSIDDKIITELQKIKFGSPICVWFAQITASNVKLKLFLERNKNILILFHVFAPPTLINDQLLLLLGPLLMIMPLNKNESLDQISTKITEELLKSPIFMKKHINIRGFFDPCMTFAAIVKVFEDKLFRRCDAPTLGVINFQEMPAVIQYWNGRETARAKLCHINNGSFLEFDNLFAERTHGPSFGISIERDSTGVVENAVIPEEMVHRETLEMFKQVVKDLKSDTPIESVVPNRINFDFINFDFHRNIYPNILVIHTGVWHPRNARRICYQSIEIHKEKLDQSSFEDIIIKLLKLSGSISHWGISSSWIANPGNHKMTDRLFTGLLEHALHVTVEHSWFMDLQLLSEENLARLRENQTAGLFQNLSRGQ